MFGGKHPRGLYVLFFTEMWERFSFYSMASVFMLYMDWKGNGHPFLREHASIINGLYVGTVYFTPFFGGLLADRGLGYRWAVILGGVVMGLGHVLLGVDRLGFFFAGLTALVVGNGLFKPNVSTLVGKLYPPNDPRLDSAYTIFYMGINLGAFLGPLVAGRLRVRFGYHVAFGAAGVGMAVSLAVFLSCRRWLVFGQQPHAGKPGEEEEEVPPAVQHNRHVALLIIFVLVVLFWMAFNQGYNTFPRWFRDCTDRRPPSWLPAGWGQPGSPLVDTDGEIPAEFGSSVNALFVLLLSPVMVWLWGRLRRRGLEPTTPAKIGLGMVLGAAAFAVLSAGGLAGADAPGVRVTPGFYVGAIALLTVGELCLSPMGLSLVSKLAAPSRRSAWMGGWFVSTAVGGYLSGVVGLFWPIWPHSIFFGALVGTSLLAALLLLAFYGRLAAAMPPEKGA
jgi:POT family proton-dependent oligopeptide transporter